MTKLFLSHNWNDKPVVEPIALRLSNIFGMNSVFYDSWSIKPGEGIIKRMNEGLESPDYVFFFISNNSLKSQMVELEWQNALYAATKGKTRVIPVRLDEAPVPAILRQNVYIDLYSNGLEVALLQIVNIAQGNSSFTPQHEGFSNLTWDGIPTGKSKLQIVIRASHYMEPNMNFAITANCGENDIGVAPAGDAIHTANFLKEKKLANGAVVNVWMIGALGGAITPKLPYRINIEAKPGIDVDIIAVLHNSEENGYHPIPRKIYNPT